MNMGTSTIEEHYEKHLGPIYSWMSGNFDENCGGLFNLLSQRGVIPHSTGIAIDLGAGHGLYTKALALCGYSVIAIDFNQHLLDELKTNTLGWGVHTIKADIRQTQLLYRYCPELIVCGGDTISHFESGQELRVFINGGVS